MLVKYCKWDSVRVLLGSGIVMFFTAAVRTSFGLGLEELMVVGLQASPAMTSAVYNNCLACWFFASLFASLLCNYVACWKLVTVGSCLIPGGLILCSFATRDWHFLIFFGAFVGVGTGLCVAPTFILVSKSFSSHRGMALSIYGLSATFGTMSMPLLQNLLLENLSIRGTILVCGALAGNLLCGAALLFPEQRTLRQARVVRTDSKEGRDSWKRTLLGYFKFEDIQDYRVAAVTVADSLFWVTQSNFNYVLPLYTQEVAGGSRKAAATLMTFTSGVLICGQLVLPLMADKGLVKPWNGYFTGLVCTGVGFVGLPLITSHRGWIFACCSMVAMGAAGCRCFYPIFLVESFGLQKLPSISGYVTLAKGAFVCLLGYVFGYFRRSPDSNSLENCFFALAGSVAVACFVWLVLLCDCFCPCGRKEARNADEEFA